jgi:phenylacetate-CoA ligase
MACSVGCSVIPLGMEFSSADCLQFIQQLRPSTILALPSFVVTLAEYVHTLGLHTALNTLPAPATTTTIATPAATASVCLLSTCITGGEMMLPAMRVKISAVLGVSRYLSTGYTSNETGAVAFPCRLAIVWHSIA